VYYHSGASSVKTDYCLPNVANFIIYSLIDRPLCYTSSKNLKMPKRPFQMDQNRNNATSEQNPTRPMC